MNNIEFITMSYEQWLEEYRPLTYNGEDGALKDFFDGSKESSDAIDKAIEENKVWTLVTTDSYQMIINPGVRIVNRSEIYITEVPWETEAIEVEYYTQDEMEDELITSISNMLECGYNRVAEHIKRTSKKDPFPSIEDLIQYEYAVDHIIEVLKETDPQYIDNQEALINKVFSLGFYDAIERVNKE